MTTYITKEGLEKLKKELEHLKNRKRKEISERLRTAIAHGDLKENFDYHAAKEEQVFIEQRIAELEEIINSAQIFSPAPSDGKIQVGSKVVLQNSGKKLTFILTGSQEANPSEGKISVESPLGRALLEKKKGQTIQIDTPQGKLKYKILDIQ